MKIFPVVLTGGAGSRLWPLSREYFPKPLLPLVGETTLLQATVTRLDGLDLTETPLIVCNEEHRFLVAEQLQELGRKPMGILLEPEGRNTAPALTITALYLAEKVPDAIMVVMPADHLIPDKDEFQNIVEMGVDLAQQGNLVTFGVVPTNAETGYGYIRRGKPIGDGAGLTVAEFVEKPDAKTAQDYIDSGDFLWNSGIFVMRADLWLEEIGKFEADMLEACKNAIMAGKQDHDFFWVDKDSFLECPGNSIDYAVMEKTEHAAVVPMESDWSDIGAWSSIWEVLPQDTYGNVTEGDVLTHDVRGSLILAQGRCVAAVGLEEMIVVDTPDALLVAPMARSQDVKAIVTQLKEKGRDEYRFHSRVYRPWGDYEGIDIGERYQVKRLTVKPGATLSLQMHHHRAEHWIVVTGTARVTRGDDVFILSENESTYIPLGVNHRLENPGAIPLEIIEVQVGSYLGEDDIVRFEDVYDRV